MSRRSSDTADSKLHDKALYVRVQQRERDAFQAAADARGLPLSMWVRLVCREAAGLNTKGSR